MSNELTTISQTKIAMWEDSEQLEQIRKLFAPKLTDLEFKFFIGIGKATNLNPFMREIWSVKYQENTPAQIFIGRDGYRKAAQAHSEYDYHQCDAVYSNDEFEVFNGEVKHKYKLTNRGELVGAYCIAKRHKSSRPMYVFAELKEYSTGKSLWNSTTGKPATMIKKVAESQCLRACFQDLLGGTYGQEEMEQDEEEKYGKLHKTSKSEDLINRLKSAKGQVIEAEVINDEETGELATAEQLEEIHALRAVKIFDSERFKNALDHYKVETLAQMTMDQANDFIGKLHKLADKE
jgi:phage recombination protein Bet